MLRRGIAKLPYRGKYVVSQCIAATVYFPLAKLAKLLDGFNVQVKHIPLSSYKDSSFYSMCTDALDRFGTRLEQRFSREEIEGMLKKSGLKQISFRDGTPFWCVIGYKQ